MSWMLRLPKNTQRSVAIGLVLLTIAAFAYYVSKHRSLLDTLQRTSPALVVLLLALYVLWFAALALVFEASLRICRLRLPFRENFLLNAYSMLTNFFVPGQGGIAVRGVYLKRQKQLKVRNFVFSTLLYYLCYAVISGVLLTVVSLRWWQAVLVVAAFAGGSAAIVLLYARRARVDRAELDLGGRCLAMLLAATAFQAIVQVAIFAAELLSIDRHIGFGQMVTYTGAANLSLFVALTPGAIGIRESFLVLSHNLHHIANTTIVAASLLDRAVFLVFLGIVFCVTLFFHGRYRRIQNAARQPQSSFRPD